MKRRTIEAIIDTEGGYVNDPLDSGGETNFGITVAVARSAGYLGAMRDMARADAYDIYESKYWRPVRGDELAALSEAIAAEVVDTAVNMGKVRAGKFLQRALNALNANGKYYPDTKVDGHIGPGTMASLRGYLAERDARTLAKALNCLQGAFYISLAEKRKKDERFVYGWLKHRVNL